MTSGLKSQGTEDYDFEKDLRILSKRYNKKDTISQITINPESKDTFLIRIVTYSKKQNPRCAPLNLFFFKIGKRNCFYDFEMEINYYKNSKLVNHKVISNQLLKKQAPYLFNQIILLNNYRILRYCHIDSFNTYSETYVLDFNICIPCTDLGVNFNIIFDTKNKMEIKSD